MTREEMVRRKKELGLTYEDISERSGVPLTTVQKVLGGITKSPRYQTMEALAEVLRENYPGHMPRTATTAADTAASERSYSSYNAGAETGMLMDTPASYNSGSYQPDSSARTLDTEEPIDQSSEDGSRHPAGSSQTAPGSRHPSGSSQAVPGSRNSTQYRYPDSYPLLPHKRQGEYTAADRDMLPDDVRTELIDGVLYDMASPLPVHQMIAMEIAAQLHNQIDQCGNDCIVFIAPSDVWLTYDDKNIFQPDVYVLCDFTMITEKHVEGAPPFVIEILSPSTRSKDMLLKSYKYAKAGVREYWTVDPKKRAVVVRDFEKDPDGTTSEEYSFDDIIPVLISGGRCSVDFKVIRDLLNRIGIK